MYRAVMMLFLALTFSPAVVAAQQPCTTDARHVVNELYRHILERGADPGSAGWVQQLESGQSTVRDIVRSIAKSPEHIQRFHKAEAGEGTPYERSVAQLYRHILGRQPDATGQRVHAELVQRNGPEAVIDRIIDSAEYDQQFGDWGLPGSGGIRFCPPGNRSANQAPAPQVVPVEQRRFRGMDRNNDGMITRNEWQGSRQSFDVHDWNNDGVLTGAEVDEASARTGRSVEDESFDRMESFEYLDANNNNRIELREWHGSASAFDRLDVNNDNNLSRSEMATFGNSSSVGTSGQTIRVNGADRWTDTGINVRAGDTLIFDAQGTVRLSGDRNDIAGVGGAASGRRAPDAPLVNQTAGALIARIGNSDTFFIGNRRSMRAPATGRLYLGVNDDALEDNSGDFQVMVTVQP
jgi:Ca2+-binding EF-hand superfamily protein